MQLLKKTGFFILSLSAWAQMNYVNSLDEAFQQAQKEDKLVFIKYYNRECSICQKAQSLLDEPEIAQAYHNKLVCYAIDAYNELSPQEAALFRQNNLRFSSVPKFVFFTKDQIFWHYTGIKVNKDFMLKLLEDISNPTLVTSNLATQYQKGDKRTSTLFNYAEYLGMQKNHALQNQVTQQLYQNFTAQKLASYQSYYVLKKLVNTTDNDFFRYWIANLDKLKGFETGINEDTEKQVLEKILIADLVALRGQTITNQKKETLKAYYKQLGLEGNIEDFWE